MILLALGLFLICCMVCTTCAYASELSASVKVEESSFLQGRIEFMETSDSFGKRRLQRPSKPVESRLATSLLPSNRGPLSNDWIRKFSQKHQDIPQPLNDNELKRLSRFEIAVLIDRSGSMNEDLNAFKMGRQISRWQWCKDQTTALSQQISRAIPDGITVIPFSDHAERYANVSSATIAEVFKVRAANGMTMLDRALSMELDNFLSKRSLKPNSKPLVVAVITDGSPNDPQKVVDKIISVSRKINATELKIVFLIIGDDPMAIAFIDYIHKSRVEAGIPFNIVQSHNFAEVCQQGLGRSLLEAVDSE